MRGTGHTDRPLPDEDVARIVRETLAGGDVDGKRVLVPDGPRTAPIPRMFSLIHEELSGRVTGSSISGERRARTTKVARSAWRCRTQTTRT